MDPQVLLALQQRIQMARDNGWSTAQIDAQLAKEGGPIRSVAALTQAIHAGAPPRDTVGDTPPPAPFRPASFGAGGRGPTWTQTAEARQASTDRALMVGRGATFGGLEELLAAIRAGTSDASFGESRRRIEERVRAARDRLSGPEAFTLEAIGGFAVPGSAAARWLALPKSVLGRVGLGAVVGGVTTAGAAALDAPDFVPGLRDVPGIALGAALGGGFSALGPVAGTARETAQGLVAPEKVGVRAARRAITDRATAAGLTPETAIRELAAIESRRPGMSLPVDADVDAFGPMLRGLIDAGQSSKTIRRQAIDRVAGANERLATDLSMASAAGGRAAVRAGRVRPRLSASAAKAEVEAAFDASALYRPFENIPIDTGDLDIRRVLRHPRVRKLWDDVKPQTPEDGPVTFLHLQQVIRRLRGASDAAAATSDIPLGQQLTRLRGELTDAVDRRVMATLSEESGQGFRAAQRAVAQQHRVVEAFDEGQMAFRSRDVRPRDVGRMLGRIRKAAGDRGEEAAQAFRTGLVDEAFTKLFDGLEASVGAKVAQLPRRLTTGGKLRHAFDSEDAFTDFIEAGLVERGFADLQRHLVGGSRTAEAGMNLLEGLQRTFVQGGLSTLFYSLNQLRMTPAVRRAFAQEMQSVLLGGEPSKFLRLLQAAQEPGFETVLPVILGVSAGVAGQNQP